MPEAASASFSARADSNLTISWPMRTRDPRLGQAERWLRYAVPGTLAVFLACLVGLAALHIQGQRAEILAGARARSKASPVWPPGRWTRPVPSRRTCGR